MKLRKTDGTVKVADKNGKAVSIFKDMLLSNGYNIETPRNGYAWIDLDSTKLLKLDSESKTVVQKNGRELDIILEKGKVFFDVAEPMEEDETFNIRTSTMAVGIRGTCGWVEIEDRNTARVFILEGTVTVAVIDPVTREVKVDIISGGDNASCVVYKPDKPGDKCDILRDRFSETAVPGFVLVELAGDMKHVAEIFNKSKTDVDLRRLTQTEAKKHLQAEQEAVRLAEEKDAKNASQDDNGGNASEPSETPAASGTPETPAPQESAKEFNYTYDSAKKTLTISKGTNTALPDYEAGMQPWAEHLGEMEKVVIADGITAIGSNAFLPAATRARAAGGEAASLKNVTLPKSVMEIKADAFAGCNNIETVYFGGTEAEWAEKGELPSFSSGMPAGKKVYFATGEVYYYYNTTDKTLTIAGDGEMGSYQLSYLPPITYFPPWWNHRSDMTTVEVKDGVTSIGFSAFEGCSSLTKITIPGGVTSIGENAFEYCSSLTDVYFGGDEAEWNALIAGKNIFYEISPAPIMHYNSTGSAKVTTASDDEDAGLSALSESDMEDAGEETSMEAEDETGEETNTEIETENTSEETNTETETEETSENTSTESRTDESSQELIGSDESGASQDSEESDDSETPQESTEAQEPDSADDASE